MPVSLDLAHHLMKTLADIRREGKVMTYLRPDSKSQVTIEYGDDNVPQRIDTIVISTQHDEFDSPHGDTGLTGRKNEIVNKTFTSHYHETKTIDVELFTWEKLDRVEVIKKKLVNIYGRF